jgi:hypothetical protein
MPNFDLDCPLIGEPVLITLEAFEVRGDPALRGFSCEMEAQCHQAGVQCALFVSGAPRPFEVEDALRFLGG